MYRKFLNRIRKHDWYHFVDVDSANCGKVQMVFAKTYVYQNFMCSVTPRGLIKNPLHFAPTVHTLH